MFWLIYLISTFLCVLIIKLRSNVVQDMDIVELKVILILSLLPIVNIIILIMFSANLLYHKIDIKFDFDEFIRKHFKVKETISNNYNKNNLSMICPR